ncbi:hypothetical protein JL722_11773 [Aureococcus anophagefferens]|nr:hypothetical protein JL722_11773 [Aureococcus anophagefferens]
MAEIEGLVRALRVGDDAATAAAAGALGDLARADDANRVLIAEAGGIPPLVDLLRNGSPNAVAALCKLAYENAANKLAIAEAGGIPPLVAIAEAGGIAPLVELLRDGNAWAKQNAAGALGNLACENAANKVAIAEAGGIAPLVELLRDGCADAKLWAAGALGNLACNDDNQVAIAEAGGIAPLVAIAEAGGIAPLVELLRAPRGRQTVGGALRRLERNNEANAVAIAVAVGLEALVELARHGRVTFGDESIVRDAGVPAKRKAAGRRRFAVASRTRRGASARAPCGTAAPRPPPRDLSVPFDYDRDSRHAFAGEARAFAGRERCRDALLGLLRDYCRAKGDAEALEKLLPPRDDAFYFFGGAPRPEKPRRRSRGPAPREAPCGRRHGEEGGAGAEPPRFAEAAAGLDGRLSDAAFFATTLWCTRLLAARAGTPRRGARRRDAAGSGRAVACGAAAPSPALLAARLDVEALFRDLGEPLDEPESDDDGAAAPASPARRRQRSSSRRRRGRRARRGLAAPRRRHGARRRRRRGQGSKESEIPNFAPISAVSTRFG